MDRRSFLKRIVQATAAAAVLEIDPERLLWVPGQKTIIDLGAVKPALVQPTLAEVAQVTFEKFDEQQSLFHSEERYAPLQRIYSPHRYRLTTGGETLILDSEGRLRDGWRHPVSPHKRERMTAEELRESYRRHLTRSENPFVGSSVPFDGLWKEK